ncbi:hypothetical protein EsH8_I_000150 [Colletotrichum jinshuiense]
MKLTTTALTSLVAFFATGSVGAAAVSAQGTTAKAVVEGNFAQTCKDIQLGRRERVGGTYFDLKAVCLGLDDKEYHTSLQLGLCLENDHGVIKWTKRGNFDKSCESCRLTKIGGNEVIMRCYCKPAHDQSIIEATININDGIRNEGGYTWCGDEMGTRTA